MMDERIQRIVELDNQYGMQTYSRLPVAFVRGKGVWLWDTAGKKYLDMLSGIGVAILGHCHPAVTGAIIDQSRKIIHTSNLYYIEPQAELARLLSGMTFGGRCFFCNSGAEANEGALKIARKYHFLNGKPRSKVICLEGSFHGRTMVTLSATGQPEKWEPFQPVVQGFEHLELNDVEGVKRLVDEDTAAVLLEPVLGESGVHPATAEFLAVVRESCDRSGAVLIFDEIQTGLGRTGSMFAHQDSGIEPDVMTLAKGLAGGVPIGAFIASGEYGNALAAGEHASTFGGNFLACSAALATLNAIEEEDLVSNAREVGKHLRSRLERMLENVPLVEEVRGAGLMLAVQLKEDLSREVVLECLERGVVLNNVTGNCVRMLPPLVIDRGEADYGAGVLEEVLLSMK